MYKRKMNHAIQTPGIVAKAHSRIKNYIHETPLIYSHSLNDMLESKIYFKLDAMQRTGAFKIRGVLNHLLTLKEEDKLPDKIVAYSTGNHGLAAAYAAQLFKIHARIYLPKNVSLIKKTIARSYGAEVVEVEVRSEAERLAKMDGENGFYYLHPSDSDTTIAGSGTMCFEALQQMEEHGYGKPDAIFASIGGGGLISGTYLAKELLSPSSLLIGAEPEIANDAHLSVTNQEIFRFQDSPETIADGLRTLGVSNRTFEYLKKLDAIYLAEEDRIAYWTAWLIQVTKVTCEPSAAISMVAAHDWIERNGHGKNLLVLISGGNIDPNLYNVLVNQEYLKAAPSLEKA